MTQTVTNSFTAEGSRTHLNVLNLMMRGPCPKHQAHRPAKLITSCVVDEDGNVSPAFERAMDSALASGLEFLRSRKGLPAHEQANEALRKLEAALSVNMKGDVLEAYLDNDEGVTPAMVSDVFAPGTHLEIYRSSVEVGLVGFDGVVPEPPVVQMLMQRLDQAAVKALRNKDTAHLAEALRMVGVPNLAAHVYEDEQLGLTLPRDKCSMLPEFDQLLNAQEIAALGLLTLRAAPSGRLALNTKRWGSSSAQALDAKVNMRNVGAGAPAAHGLMSMVNYLLLDSYALDVQFTTVRNEPSAFLKALETAFPEVEFKPLAVGKVETAGVLDELETDSGQVLHIITNRVYPVEEEIFAPTQVIAESEADDDGDVAVLEAPPVVASATALASDIATMSTPVFTPTRRPAQATVARKAKSSNTDDKMSAQMSFDFGNW